MTTIHQPDSTHAPAGREASEVDLRGILGFGLGLFVVAAVVHVLVWLLFGYFTAREAKQQPREYPLAAADANRLPPEPRLQVNPRQDLADFREKEDEILRTYGWMDRNADIVRIPIDAAMTLTLERGLPARPRSPK